MTVEVKTYTYKPPMISVVEIKNQEAHDTEVCEWMLERMIPGSTAEYNQMIGGIQATPAGATRSLVIKAADVLVIDASGKMYVMSKDTLEQFFDQVDTES